MNSLQKMTKKQLIQLLVKTNKRKADQDPQPAPRKKLRRSSKSKTSASQTHSSKTNTFRDAPILGQAPKVVTDRNPGGKQQEPEEVGPRNVSLASLCELTKNLPSTLEDWRGMLMCRTALCSALHLGPRRLL